MKVREVFDEFGLKISDGDEAFYLRYDKDSNLEGMVSSHVDDFILARTDNFLKEITRKIEEKLDVSNLEDNKVRFTGIDVMKIGDKIERSI